MYIINPTSGIHQQHVMVQFLVRIVSGTDIGIGLNCLGIVPGISYAGIGTVLGISYTCLGTGQVYRTHVSVQI